MIIVKVSGSSMVPLLIPNQEYQFDETYKTINRNDIVYIDYVSRLVKFVKGLPNDKLTFSKVSYSYWNILINDEILQTTKGVPYTIKDKKKSFLEGYTKNNQNKIPENCYFILGNVVHGSQDSILYGMFYGENIIAKLIGGNNG